MHWHLPQSLAMMETEISSACPMTRRVYTFTYNHNNQLTKARDPLGGETACVYDGAGNLLTFTGTSGLNTRFSYDILDNLTEVTLPSGLKTQYTYDEMGNVTAVEDTMGASPDIPTIWRQPHQPDKRGGPDGEMEL